MARPRGLTASGLERLEDVLWMAETGECAEGAARRLGMNPKTFAKWCSFHAHDAWKTLRDRDPTDHNIANGKNGHGLTQYSHTGAARKRRREAKVAQAA